MARPLPKSLHTITVIVNIARHLHTQDEGERDPTQYVADALRILSYPDAAVIHMFGNEVHDPHALAFDALRKFRKEISV